MILEGSDKKEKTKRKTEETAELYLTPPPTKAEREIVLAQMVMLLVARFTLDGHVITIKVCYSLHWVRHSAEVVVM